VILSRDRDADRLSTSIISSILINTNVVQLPESSQQTLAFHGVSRFFQLQQQASFRDVHDPSIRN
jgi:hypothetical protein